MIQPYYADDLVTLYHGSCRDVFPQLPPADLLLTDPPYGILADSGSAATRRSAGNRDDGRVAWDVAPAAGLLAEMITRTKAAMIWGGLHFELGATFGYLVWDKQIDGLNFGETEVCWTNLRFAPRVFRYRAVGVDGGKVHPTQKPEALMRWCLGFCDGSVIDPFAGSGTTLVAAKRIGRRAIGIELDEEYCEVAARRLAQGTLAGLFV